MRKPFFWKQRNCWYVRSDDGRTNIRLDPDESKAYDVWQRTNIWLLEEALASGARNAPDCAAGIVTATGDIATPVRTPDWTLAFGGSYDIPLPSAGVIIAPAVNVTYRSSLETGTANATIFAGASPPAFDGTVFPNNPFDGEFITGSLTDAHFLVGASLSMRTEDGNWLLSVECDNCFDESYGQSSLVNYTYLNPPRTWMVKARRRF